MAGFELTIRTAVRDSHIYKDSWAPTVREEFVCYQECVNEHDRHTVAVYGDGDSNKILGHLPRQFSRVAFLFLDHDGSITGRVTGRRQYCRERGGMKADPSTAAHQQLAFAYARLQAEGHSNRERSGMLASSLWPA